MPTYEITWLQPNGDWTYMRGEYRDFQAAVEAGLPPKNDPRRLIRVELMADNVLPYRKPQRRSP